MKNFLELFNKAEENQYFVKGLFSYCGIIILLAATFHTLIPQKLKDNTFFSWFFFCGLLSILFAIVFTWFRNRGLPTFKNNEIGIIVAFNSIEENQKYIKKLKDVIKTHLEKKLLHNKYKIHALTPNHKVKNKEQASALCKKTSAHLIIWGNVSVGKDGNKGLAISFPKKELSLTFKSKPQINPAFFSDTLSLFNNEATTYHEDNEIVELENMKNNITKVSQFALAKCLAINFYFQESLEILEHLKNEVDFSDINLIDTNIDFIRYNKIVYDYNTKVYFNDNFHINKQIFKEIFENISRISRFIPNLYILQAALHVLLLEYKKAENVLNLLKKKQVRHNSINVSLAFIHLCQNNIAEAQKKFYHTNLLSLPTHNINHILDFYTYFIEKYPKKFSFLYGYAYINMKCQDPQMAINAFSKFIEEPHNTSKHWKEQARRYITACKEKIQGENINV